MGAPTPTYGIMLPTLALFIVPAVPLVLSRPLVPFGTLIPVTLGSFITLGNCGAFGSFATLGSCGDFGSGTLNKALMSSLSVSRF
jgi:hypothetical protein